MSSHRDESGGVAVLVAVFVSAVALIASAFVSEFGLAFANKRFLQNAVEAAALAAASHVREVAPVGASCSELEAAIEDGSDASWAGASTVSTAAVADKFFDENLGNDDGATFGGVEVTCDPSMGLLVTVEARQHSQTAIGRAAGTGELLVRTEATAVVATPKDVVGLRPVGICLARAREAAATPGQEYAYPIDKGDPACGLAPSTWGLINFEGSRGNGGDDGVVSDIITGHSEPVSSSVPGEEVWIDGSPGMRSNLIGHLQDLVGDEVILPVYDVYRDKKGQEVPPLEESLFLESGPDDVSGSAQSQPMKGSKDGKENGKDFRIVGFITIEITAVSKDELRLKHKRFSPVAKINRECAFGLAQCDLGARIVKLVG